MKEKINRIAAINWIKKKHIPEYADLVLFNVPGGKEAINVALKDKVNALMNIHDEPIMIRMITSQFHNALIKSMSTLMQKNVWSSLEFEKGYSTGVLIANEIIYYVLSKRPEATYYDVSITVFDKESTLLLQFTQFSDSTPVGNNVFVNPLYQMQMSSFVQSSQGISDKDFTKDELVQFICGSNYRLVVLFELFRKYAEVETKILKPKMKAELFKCKYHNDSDHQIEIMDSTWFTEFIKSEAFKVRGHFRLQAHGEGRVGRKLIWIKDFKKEGYTRKAKKELETNF